MKHLKTVLVALTAMLSAAVADAQTPGVSPQPDLPSTQMPGSPSETTGAGNRSQKALERENRELRQPNEILRKASAYFAVAELDRRSKT